MRRCRPWAGRFVPYINHSYQRTGTLWEGRFKANAVQEESYLLACYRYIELNPVRAAMVDKPEDYPWSSYRANALGELNPLLTPHGLYLGLGTNPADRQSAYRSLCSSHLDSAMLRDVRSCLQTGTPLGNDRFRAQIERVLRVKVGYSSRGRPNYWRFACSAGTDVPIRSARNLVSGAPATAVFPVA